MRIAPSNKILCGALACVLTGAACQQGAVTVETNTNATSTNTTTTTNTNATTAPISTTALETREPARYRASLAFTVEAQGKPPQALPPMQVARDGDNRRYAITLPAVGEVIFLDRADKRYLIMTQRK